jgi:hypothetical protein
MDDISYVFPGKADYKTVLENNTHVQKQKRMVLCNFREAHRTYSEEKINTPEHKVGFSKFCSTRRMYSRWTKRNIFRVCLLYSPKL